MDPAGDQRDVVLVQPGWQIFSRDGEPLGEVLQVDEDTMDLDRSGSRLKLSTNLLMEQEESEMRARISLDADAVDDVGIQVSEI